VKRYIAKDLMVPISEYATVSEGATLLEAVVALEKAQEEFTHTRYSHRAVLVLGENKRVVGKLSQLDFLRALESDPDCTDNRSELAKFGFSARAIAAHHEQCLEQKVDRNEMLASAADLKVEACMQTLSEGEYIDQNTSLDTATHHLVSGKHLSLLVTDGPDIVGILRLSDVFAAAFHVMKEKETKDVK
jgi:CBS domain-containing protein